MSNSPAAGEVSHRAADWRLPRVAKDSPVDELGRLCAKTGGKISWRWRVSSRTKPGCYPVTVDCGKAGKHTASLRVRA